MFENDSKKVPEQTVQVSTTGEETYEPEPPKPTVEVKRLQTQLESTCLIYLSVKLYPFNALTTSS